jgi:hypothetical protein
MTVAEWLTASRQAHRAALLARQKKDFTANRAHLATAVAARTNAHTLDPEHADAAWGDERPDQHERLMTFYAQQGV